MEALPEAMADFTMASLNTEDDFIYTFGGVVSNTGDCTQDVHRYTISTDIWDTISMALPSAKKQARAVPVDGGFWLIGGYR